MYKGFKVIGAIVTILEIGIIYIYIGNGIPIPTIWLTFGCILGVFFGWNGNTWCKNQMERNGYDLVRSTPSDWRFFKGRLSDQTRFNRISSLCFTMSLVLFIETATTYLYLTGENHDISWLEKISWEPMLLPTLVPALTILPKAFLSPTLLTSLAVAIGGYVGGHYLSLTYLDTVVSPFIAITAVVLLFVGYTPFKRWLSSNKRVKNDA